MHALIKPVLGLACCLAVANGADWLLGRADAQRTGWQPDERHLTPKTVKGMRLLWKKQLDADALSSTLMLGPIITHRGIKELVVVVSAVGRVSAVDADLGTLFWTRDLPQTPAQTGCAPALPQTPTVLSTAVATARPLSANDDDDFADGSRPIWVAAPDGSMYSLRAATGEDLTPAAKLPRRGPDSFTGFGNLLIAGWSGRTSVGCTESAARLASLSADGLRSPATITEPRGEHLSGMAVGVHGDLYARVDTPKGEVGLALAASTLQTREILRRANASRPIRDDELADSNITVFPWNGREVAAMATSEGLVLWSRQEGDASRSKSDAFGLDSSRLTGLTTWAEDGGERWLSVVASGRLLAFHLAEKGGKPGLQPAWRSDRFVDPGAPVVGGGVVYFIAQGAEGQAKLVALDARTGATMFSTSEGLESKSRSGALALANGHLCFTTSDGVLYCFGLPLEI